MTKALFPSIFLLATLCGCVWQDDPAEFALRQKERVASRNSPAERLSREACLRIAPDAEEFALQRLYINASASEEEAALPCRDADEKRRFILAHAQAMAALAAALGLPPATPLLLEPLADDWCDVPSEEDLNAVLWFNWAQSGKGDGKELREKELALHCAFLEYLAVLEESDLQAAAPLAIRRRGHLVRLSLLELIGERDFSRVPAILRRIEKELVREAKGL